MPEKDLYNSNNQLQFKYTSQKCRAGFIWKRNWWSLHQMAFLVMCIWHVMALWQKKKSLFSLCLSECTREGKVDCPINWNKVRTAVQHKFRTQYKISPLPRPTIYAWYAKFMASGSVGSIRKVMGSLECQMKRSNICDSHSFSACGCQHEQEHVRYRCLAQMFTMCDGNIWKCILQNPTGNHARW